MPDGAALIGPTSLVRFEGSVLNARWRCAYRAYESCAIWRFGAECPMALRLSGLRILCGLKVRCRMPDGAALIGPTNLVRFEGSVLNARWRCAYRADESCAVWRFGAECPMALCLSGLRVLCGLKVRCRMPDGAALIGPTKIYRRTKTFRGLDRV